MRALVCISYLNSSVAIAFLIMLSKDGGIGRQSGGIKGEVYSYVLGEKAILALDRIQLSVFTLILEVTSCYHNFWGGHLGFPQLISSVPAHVSVTHILS